MIDRKRILCTALAVLLILTQVGILRGLRPAALTDPISGRTPPEITPLQLGDGEDGPTEPVEVTAPTEPTQEPQPDVPETKPDTGNDGEGQENGNQGGEGGEDGKIDLALVLTWYRYGSEATTIVCGPSETVHKSLNTAQLVNGELRCHFSLTGAQSKGVSIRSAQVRAGDGTFTEIGSSGSIPIELPDGGTREYTIRVLCETAAGEALTFTYVLNCSHSADLELELRWHEKNNGFGTLHCAPNAAAAKTVKSRELTEHVFGYSLKLTGGAADGAKLLRGSYTAGSGLSGELDIGGGTLVLQPGEKYVLTFEAEYDGMTVYFRFTIDYTEAADVALTFTWLERGSIPRSHLCQPDGQTTIEVRSNQLSAGSVKYELALSGGDAEDARILNISCNGRRLEQSGAIPMELPAGASENLYTVTVSVLVNGQQLRYEVILRYSMDVTLEMSYALMGGELRTVLCENGKTRTAEPVYDDELAQGLLAYEMKLSGSAGEGLTIREVQCYQSGSGRTVRLDEKGTVALLLKNGRTGENTFTVTAGNAAGTEYIFTISIPYKHRGEQTVKIAASLSDGQTIINGT